MSVRDSVREPPWLADLPRASTDTPGCPLRGRARSKNLPGTATTESNLSLDYGRALTLGLLRRCSICGCALGRIAYSIATQEIGTPRNAWRDLDGVAVTRWQPGPMHPSCAAWTVQICPFLRYEHARYRFDPHEKGTRRGAAAIIGFRSYGYTPEPADRDPRSDWGWAYFDPSETISFADSSKTIGPLYDAVIAADAQVIDMATRLYWADDTAPDINRMGGIVRLLREQPSVTIGDQTCWPVPSLVP
jgi:hypothetical protein